MSSKSRKVVTSDDARESDFESQRRVRTELARSSTTLKRGPQPSDATLEAVQASLEAAFSELDHLEQPRRMPPPLPKMPPPLPKNVAALPQACTATTAAPAPRRPEPQAEALPQPRRSAWRRWLGG